MVTASDQAEVCTWRVHDTGEEALAMFSTQALATSYAEAHCAQEYRIVQMNKIKLARLLADSFRQQMKYAALDPQADSVRQLFVIRDLLAAARDQFSEQQRPTS